MALPKVVTRDEWLRERKELLAKEKELTRTRDALSAERRRLPIPSCSAGVDQLSKGLIQHLHLRDTTLAYVSRAPIEKLERYRKKKGWTDMRWYSSYGSDFNHDFKVTVDESVAPAEYNYKTKAEHEKAGTGYYFEGEQPIEQPGTSCFLRVDDRVFHTYSTFGRGAEMLGGSYYWLDLTALGRQEEWEEPKGRVDSAYAARPDFAS